MADCHRLGPLEPTGRGQSFQLAFGKEQSATFYVSMHSVSSMSYPRRLTEARHSFLPFPRRNLSLHLPFCGFLCDLYQFHKVWGRGGVLYQISTGPYLGTRTARHAICCVCRP